MVGLQRSEVYRRASEDGAVPRGGTVRQPHPSVGLKGGGRSSLHTLAGALAEVGTSEGPPKKSCGL